MRKEQIDVIKILIVHLVDIVMHKDGVQGLLKIVFHQLKKIMRDLNLIKIKNVKVDVILNNVVMNRRILMDLINVKSI